MRKTMAFSAIPKGSLVLVTGVNGFIGSHVADQLLNAGFKVRGTTRDEGKAEMMCETFHKKYTKDAFETIIIPDMSADDAFNEAVKGCAGVAHVASDLTLRPNPHEVVTPILNSVKNILRVSAAQPSIKRFVFTSSSITAKPLKPNVKFHIDSNTWYEECIEAAWKPAPYEQARCWDVYAASKMEAEKACWDFVKTEKPDFVLSTVLPNFTIGQILHPKQPGSSSAVVKGLYEGNQDMINLMKTFPPQWAVDVKDVGRLHLAALGMPDVQNERLFGMSEPFNFNSMMACLREIDPNDQERLPSDLENPAYDLCTVSNERSVEILQRMGRPGFTSLQDSIRDLILPRLLTKSP